MSRASGVVTLLMLSTLFLYVPSLLPLMLVVASIIILTVLNVSPTLGLADPSIDLSKRASNIESFGLLTILSCGETEMREESSSKGLLRRHGSGYFLSLVSFVIH